VGARGECNAEEAGSPPVAASCGMGREEVLGSEAVGSSPVAAAAGVAE